MKIGIFNFGISTEIIPSETIGVYNGVSNEDSLIRFIKDYYNGCGVTLSADVINEIVTKENSITCGYVGINSKSIENNYEVKIYEISFIILDSKIVSKLHLEHILKPIVYSLSCRPNIDRIIIGDENIDPNNLTMFDRVISLLSEDFLNKQKTIIKYGFAK